MKQRCKFDKNFNLIKYYESTSSGKLKLKERFYYYKTGELQAYERVNDYSVFYYKSGIVLCRTEAKEFKYLMKNYNKDIAKIFDFLKTDSVL